MTEATQTQCPECGRLKPADPDDVNDVVLMRMDWRKAGRPERSDITVPIGESPMCLECHQRIRNEYAKTAPNFDAKGRRVS